MARRRHPLVTGATLLVAALLFSACDWSQSGFGPEHTSFNPFESTISTANVSGLRLRWSAPVGDRSPKPAPTVANGILYVAGDRLYAFDAATGSARWSTQKIPYLGSSPVVAEGLVFIVAEDGGYRLVALDAGTGKPQWTQQLDDLVGYPPTVVGGVVYLGGAELRAFDAKTGSPLWSMAAGNGHAFSGPPAVAGGMVYAGADKVYAVDAKTGTTRWSTSTGGSIYTSPAVANGMVYIGNEHLHALDATTGTRRWSSAAETRFGSPAVANGVVYVGADVLVALNATTGVQLWSATPGTNDAAPAVANGVVYTGNSGLQNLHALNAATGAELWVARTQVGIASPVVVNGTVYVSADQLYAYSLPISGPQLVVSPAFPDSYKFGDPSSSARTFTIRNVGTAATSAITGRISGPDAAHFRLTSDGCGGTTLAAGASCSVTVSFAPSRSGSLTASLALTATAGGTASVLLAGTADPLTISPAKQDFGPVFAGSTSTQVLTVTNLSGGPVGPIANISVSTKFTVSADGCSGHTLPHGSSCPMAVKFAPTYSTGYEEALAVQASGFVAIASLVGGGRSQFVLSPSTKDFGQVRAGTTASSTFTITNVSPSSAGPVTDAIEMIYGQHFDWYRITADTCATRVLSSGASCTLVVTFAPQSTGFANAQLRTSGLTSGAVTAGLVGTGS